MIIFVDNELVVWVEVVWEEFVGGEEVRKFRFVIGFVDKFVEVGSVDWMIRKDLDLV